MTDPSALPDLDNEYNNRGRVPDYPAIVARWQADARAFRASVQGEIDVAYGEEPRQVYDLFHTKDDQGGPLVCFIHGGYWRSFEKETFSHLARGLSVHGISVALPEYRLCPHVKIADIVTDIVQFAIHLHRRTGRKIVATGHSAGGHLAACLAAADWAAHGMPEDLVTSGIGISGLYDLRPLLPTGINETLGMDEAAAREASPLLWPTPQGRPFEAWVGALESSEFLRQSRTLSAVWTGAGAPTRYVEIAGANHFTAVDSLAEPMGALTRALVDLVRAA
ncbi:MAG: alpha/beta hydrolase [Hyphomicrobiales bacterium]